MGTNSFIIHIQTKVLFGDIPKDVEKCLILQILS